VSAVIYRAVAARRHRLPGATAACALHQHSSRQRRPPGRGSQSGRVT
jgi:predicted DCC family thiol-disulfide oxidoreductase YuxK